MSKIKSKVNFKPPAMDAFDSKKLPFNYVLDEVGAWAAPDPNFDFQKELIRVKRSNNNLIFAKPKSKCI